MSTTVEPDNHTHRRIYSLSIEEDCTVLSESTKDPVVVYKKFPPSVGDSNVEFELVPTKHP